MKRTSYITFILCICACLGMSACNGEEKEKKKLMAEQINLIDKQMQHLEKGNSELAARTDNLGELLRKMDAQMDRTEPRLEVAGSATERLRGLYFGTDTTEGVWEYTRPVWNTGMLLIVAVLVLGLWVLWRLREKKLELAMNQEIDQVINRLSDQARQDQGETIMEAEKEVPPHPSRPPSDTKTQGQEAPESEAKPEPAEAAEQKPEPPRKEKAPEEQEETKPETDQGRETEERKTTEPGKEPEAGTGKKKSSRPAKKTARKSAPKKKEKKDTRKAPRAPAKKCRVKGCNNKHRSKGFCNKHYQQWRRGNLVEEVE
ncbi:MAG: hypothetical protein R6V10_08050 [bacterium]